MSKRARSWNRPGTAVSEDHFDVAELLAPVGEMEIESEN